MQKAEKNRVADIRELIDGAYVLQEWHEAGTVSKPPDVAARFVLLDGIVMAILSRSVAGVRITVAQYGSYTLDADAFTYCYTDRTEFPPPSSAAQAGDPEGIRFDGVRSFAVDAAPGRVRLLSPSNERAEFLFTPEGLVYAERGAVLRKWQRASLQRQRPF